jgi:hypothetical protein
VQKGGSVSAVIDCNAISFGAAAMEKQTPQFTLSRIKQLQSTQSIILAVSSRHL